MDTSKFVYGLIFAMMAYVFFKLHKLWLKRRKEKNEFITKTDTIKHWIVIVMLIVISIVFLFKSL